MRKLFKLFLVAIVCAGSAFAWYRHALSPVDSGNQVRRTVKIEKGSGVRDIARLLEKEKLIRSTLAFVTYVRLHRLETALQAGTFILRSGYSLPEIVERVQKGIGEEGVMTIPEGWTVQDIDALLAEQGLIEIGALVQCAATCDFSSFDFLPAGKGRADRGGKLEGYLFPDTYYVNTAEFVPKFFLERLLTTFRKRVIDPLGAEIANSKRSLHAIITMASLIEEETRTAEERPVVSGILWKRFDAGAGLGVDATVRYILEKQTGALTVKDLNTDSPYNLRKFRGLPPGPIASPSLSSIEAALRPKESPYWYYLHGQSGQVHYAETNEEHNMNKYKYLQ